MSKVIKGIKKLLGVKDHVGSKETLAMRFEQAPKVFCIACRKHIYFLGSSAKNNTRLVGTGTYPARTDMTCPACGRILCAFENGKPKFKTDRGWM